MVMHHELNISFQTDCSELVKIVSDTKELACMFYATRKVLRTKNSF